MTLIQRTLPTAIKVAGVAGVAGLGVYTARQFSTVFAESQNGSKPAFGGWGFTTLRVQSVKTVNHDTKRLVLEFPDPGSRSGLALTSALLTITHPEGAWMPTLRPYTPISDLDEPGQLELMVKKYPAGKGSGYMHSLQPGDSLKFATSLKGYQWRANEAPHIYLLAGGAGITPIYQLIRGILKNPEDKTKMTLVFGVNSEEDLLLKEELDAYAKEFPGRFEYSYTISRPKTEAGVFRKGYVDEELLRSAFKGEVATDAKVFVCGPPAMEDSLVGSRRAPGVLGQLGVRKDQVVKF
ncbi:ferredoxin reductase-like protein [Aspergillus ellipticus CBS 707.79]|uniref:NADH-cytochrome b5 reductase n=1 Tax=Aspergillus ellipticus CBS 707.79 TaxID=1448320 RepID=A0A319DGF4_9EURO|nr:ferredoxin reductase-like protein [Aspergillus ellipticus CBS 707.79]